MSQTVLNSVLKSTKLGEGRVRFRVRVLERVES